MDVYKVKGGHRLQGTVKISGAKNSAVALIPASILANSSVTIGGIPEISDAWTLKALLEEIGGEVTFDHGQMTIDPTNMINKNISPNIFFLNLYEFLIKLTLNEQFIIVAIVIINK